MIMQIILVVLMLVMSAFQVGMIMQVSWFGRAAHSFCEHTRQQMLLEELVARGVARLCGDRPFVREAQEKKVVDEAVATWQQPDARLYRGLIRCMVLSSTRYELDVSLFHTQNGSQPLCSHKVVLVVDESGGRMTIQYQAPAGGPSQPIVKS